jgi:peptidoglycan/xylan/chitin deacetylase (PgdA/CDA1 family)
MARAFAIKVLAALGVLAALWFGDAPTSWLIAGLIALLALALIAWGVFDVNSSLWAPTLWQVPGVNAVALTFDDGPDPVVTPAVLGLLEQAGARATFFCVGQRAEAHPEVMAAIRARGHGVENHSYSHPNGFALRGPVGLSREIRRAQEAIERVGGGRPRLFRAPAGIQNPWLAPALASAGLRLVSWTRRGYDTVSHDGARVAARLGRGLRARDILLLHDGSSARDRTRLSGDNAVAISRNSRASSRIDATSSSRLRRCSRPNSAPAQWRR